MCGTEHDASKADEQCAEQCDISFAEQILKISNERANLQNISICFMTQETLVHLTLAIASVFATGSQPMVLAPKSSAMKDKVPPTK